MLKYIIFFIFAYTNIYSQWQKIEGPKSISRIENIKTGSNFIVGSFFDPYFSFDGGKSWEIRNNSLPEERSSIQQIEVENDIVYIHTTRFNEIKNEYFCYSTDKGLSWNKIGENQDYSGSKILIDFKIKNNEIYTLPYSERFITKSTNYGKTWDTLASWSKEFQLMDYLEVNNDTLVVADGGAIGSGGSFCSGVLVSIDGGNSWIPRNNGLDVCNINCIKLDGSNLYVGKKDGFYYSSNLGETWRRAGSIVYNTYVNDIEIIKDTVYLATELGLYKSIDLWKEWEEISQFHRKKVFNMHYGNNTLYLSSCNKDYTMNYPYFSYNLIDFDTLNFNKEISYGSLVINYPRILFSTYNFSSNEIYKKENLLTTNYKSLMDKQKYPIYHLDNFGNNLISTLLLTSPSNEPREFLISSDLGENWEKKEYFKDATFPRDILFLNNDTILISSPDNLYISDYLKEESRTFSTTDSLITKDLQTTLFFKKIQNKIYLYGGGRIYETDEKLSYWKSILSQYDYSKEDSVNSHYGKSILDMTVYNNNIYIIIDNSHINNKRTILSKSTNFGETWVNVRDEKIENLFHLNLISIENNIFLNTRKGVYLSKDYGSTWNEINEGIFPDSFGADGEFHLYNDTIIFNTRSGVYYRSLSELGIEYTTVEKTEKRNYLYTFPPFPQPTKQEVKISTYWDSALPFTVDDVEIYNLAGIKINTTNKLSINKETNYNGHIIWDTSGEQAGIYIVSIKHGTETRTQKILVEK